MRTPDGALRGSRSAWLGLLCGLLPVVSSCLVTENTDFRGAMAKPQPVGLRPAPASAVPFIPDPDCASEIKNERAMRFVSTIFYPDAEQKDLFARLVVNGNAVRDTQVRVDVNGTTMRPPQLGQQCVPYSALSLPCNLVELLTSTDLDKVSADGRPAAGALDPDFGITWWLVLGTSEDQPGASRDDCAALFLDGGV